MGRQLARIYICDSAKQTSKSAGDSGGRCKPPRGFRDADPGKYFDFSPFRCPENAFCAINSHMFVEIIHGENFFSHKLHVALLFRPPYTSNGHSQTEFTRTESITNLCIHLPMVDYL